MRLNYLTRLLSFGINTLLFKKEDPILGTIIITDYCNLNCKHCAVNNINKIMHPYTEIVEEMERFHEKGIRILFLSGGETMLWKDGNSGVKDLIAKAREIGFFIINIVTNGTETLNIPEADLVFLSLDGMEKTHNEIRGNTWNTIMKNLDEAGDTNICIYNAVNKMNRMEIEDLCRLAAEHPRLNSISFNFHTPYRLTEYLCLEEEDKREAVFVIKKMIDKGYPIFNLKSTLDLYLENTWKRPCKQCVVSENGRWYDCGRCSEIEGLCEECGYLFAVEFSAIFSGNTRAIFDMMKVYTRFV